MGGAILEIYLEKYKIQMFRKDKEVVSCVVSDHGRDVKFHSVQPVINQIKVNC